MPRKARVDAAGALHHIIVRGIDRWKIFWDDEGRDCFVKRLRQVWMETQTLELSKRFGISQPAASQSVTRGEKIVKEKGLKLIGNLS